MAKYKMLARYGVQVASLSGFLTGLSGPEWTVEGTFTPPKRKSGSAKRTLVKASVSSLGALIQEHWRGEFFLSFAGERVVKITCFPKEIAGNPPRIEVYEGAPVPGHVMEKILALLARDKKMTCRSCPSR